MDNTIDPQKMLGAFEKLRTNPELANSPAGVAIFNDVKQGKYKDVMAQYGLELTSQGIRLGNGEKVQSYTSLLDNPRSLNEYKKDVLRAEGKPVALSDKRVEPTFAGEIARAPIKLLGNVATNVRAAADTVAGKSEREALTPLQTDLTGELPGIGLEGQRDILDIKESGRVPTNEELAKAFGKDMLNSIAAGAEAASYVVGGGAAGVAGKGAVQAAKTAGTQALKETAKQAIKQTTKEGFIAGITGGFGTEAQKEDASLGSILASTAIGGAAGAGVGTAAGAVPVAAKVAGQTAKKIVTTPLNAAKNLRGQKLVAATDVATREKVGQELVRQGLDENVVKVVANASDNNIQDFQKMYQAAKNATTDPRSMERATDITGKTFVDRLRHVEKINNAAGKQLDVVAQNLKGKSVDYAPIVQGLEETMAELGARQGFAPDGTPNIDFRGSDFEGIKPVETAINNVYSRLRTEKLDAQGLHRLKRFIDNQVNYGKETGGLTGQAEGLLKSLRRGIDTLLDTNFPEYKQVNDTFASSKNLIDSTNKILGNTRSLGEELKDAKAGDIMRRLLGNSANRNNIAQVVSEIQKYVKSTGYDDGKDLVEQVVFADLLESIFGTQATTGLQGQVQRAITAGQELVSGNILKATGKTAGQVINKATRLNEQRRDAALRAILGLDPKVEKAVLSTEEKVGRTIAGGATAIYTGKKISDKK